MNTETKSADALARELAQQAILQIVSGFCDSVNPIRPQVACEIILRETKLRELCAVAEALRMALLNLKDAESHGIGQGGAIERAEQALAALDGGGK